MSSQRKNGQRRIRLWKAKRTSPGAAPGMITLAEDAMVPRIRVTTYDSVFIQELDMPDLKALQTHLDKHPDRINWIELQGFGDRRLLEQFCADFAIHRLEMEDVINNYQRPKLEDYDDHLFVVTRLMHKNGDDQIRNDQFSLF